MKDFRENTSPDIKVFLIGNKSDLEESRLVTKEQGLKFKEDNNIFYFTETSAKSGANVQNVFIEAAKVLYQDYLRNNESKSIIEKNPLQKIEIQKEKKILNESKSKIKLKKDRKIQIFAFSTNKSENTPNDIIQIFLEQKNHKLIEKTRFSIAFSTIINSNLSEETSIFITSIRNLSKEYFGTFEANYYLLFIDLEKRIP